MSSQQAFSDCSILTSWDIQKEKTYRNKKAEEVMTQTSLLNKNLAERQKRRTVDGLLYVYTIVVSTVGGRGALFELLSLHNMPRP